jgi:hypothetical protein
MLVSMGWTEDKLEGREKIFHIVAWGVAAVQMFTNQASTGAFVVACIFVGVQCFIVFVCVIIAVRKYL